MGLLAGSLALAAPARAASIAVKAYTTADGLPHNEVRAISQDARGFLWFGTPEGLSRFDGYRFTTVGTTGQGLPNPLVTAVLEDEDGGRWVSTRGGGVVRFGPDGQPARVYTLEGAASANRVITLYRDRRRWLWAGTHYGAFVLRSPEATFEAVGPRTPVFGDGELWVWSFAEDVTGTVWISTNEGLMSWREGGPVGVDTGRRLGVKGPHDFVLLLADGEGRIWGGGASGLWSFRPSADDRRASTPGDRCDVTLRDDEEVRLASRPGGVCHYRPADGGNYQVSALLRARDGVLWVATQGHGLLAIGRPAFRQYKVAQGLIDDSLSSLFEDRDENLWVGAPSGVMRLQRLGFVSYGAGDGLVDPRVASLVTDGPEGVCALGPKGLLQCLRGGRFRGVRPRVPPPLAQVGVNQLMVSDRRGSWWLRAPTGLYAFPPGDPLVELTRRPRRFAKGSGLPADRPSRVFADSRNDLWVGMWSAGQNTVVRRDGRTGAFEWISAPEGWDAGRVPDSFAEDAGGVIWIGFIDGGVARYRRGRLELVASPRRRAGATPHVRALYFDARGRLWFAAEQDGLGRIDDPGAEHPKVAYYGKHEGLASDNVRCVVEDQWGRLYVGTQQGVDRLEPANGLVRHFTSDDGLARGAVEVCTRSAGRLWFGTSGGGLSSYTPRPEPKAEPPTVFIDGLRVAGVPRQLSLAGVTTVADLELASPGQLQIDFASVGFRPGRGIRYQYRLEGADRDWSPPTDERSVNYASLSPGSYRFLVRAIDSEGLVSPTPASVGFSVVPPWWRRPWFGALVLLAAALAAVAIIRYRVAMLLRLERVRTRIASDLHDDIGSSLSQIAVLGEVVRARVGDERPEVAEPMALIGNLSREAVDAMSDIVWAIDPQKDHLPDLAHRMRRLASDLLPARGIAFDFHVAETARDPRLGADVRREVFLVFKEALSNAVRHSGCARMAIDLRLEGGFLKLTVSDDGCGFDVGADGDGHGLGSMRRRAHGVGGTLELVSGPGTRIDLRVPVHGRTARHRVSG